MKGNASHLICQLNKLNSLFELMRVGERFAHQTLLTPLKLKTILNRLDKTKFGKKLNLNPRKQLEKIDNDTYGL